MNGRRLIHIPIIHTEVDMGSLAELLKKKYIQRYGVHKWRHHLKKIDELWTNIENCLEQKHLCYSQVKIYQDGLPVCGNELQIVEEIANRCGRNHKLLLTLINKGATLIGTEDPNLLTKEYQLIKNATSGKVNRETATALKNYIAERDAFIARRIDETLKEGETGILFLGMLHKVTEILPSDITVENLKYY